jgi:mannose/fructose-specific phosphotransferase system component IIA
MSEVVPARGIVLAHGELGHGLVDAVRQIAGAEADALVPLSNRGLSPVTLADAIREHITGPRTYLFTDLPSGSCGFVSRKLLRDVAGLVVVSGVNLPLLLEFVMSRHLPDAELSARLLEKGRSAMGCSPAPPTSHADRIASRG